MSRERERILLLGDPGLRQISEPVDDFASTEFHRDAERLIDALGQFRREYGFGRAISAPQIGIHRRMIAMNLGEGPFLIVNPVLSGESAETFTLWDDCMSFPWLMVRVRRHQRVDLAYSDGKGEKRNWNRIGQAVSELLQHEVDHLEGILAVDRALDGESIIARRVYEENKEQFDRLVDYSIAPTLA